MAEKRSRRWLDFLFLVALGAFDWFGVAIVIIGALIAGVCVAFYKLARLARRRLRHA
jgi:hypothetical protein